MWSQSRSVMRVKYVFRTNPSGSLIHRPYLKEVSTTHFLSFSLSTTYCFHYILVGFYVLPGPLKFRSVVSKRDSTSFLSRVSLLQESFWIQGFHFFITFPGCEEGSHSFLDRLKVTTKSSLMSLFRLNPSLSLTPFPHRRRKIY